MNYWRRMVVMVMLAGVFAFAGWPVPVGAVSVDTPPCHEMMVDVTPDDGCASCDLGHCCGGMILSTGVWVSPLVPWVLAPLPQTYGDGVVPDPLFMPPKALI